MNEPTCSVSEATHSPGKLKRGMCEKHYRRWRKQLANAGLPLPPVLNMSAAPPCITEGCDGDIRQTGSARGMCKSCYGKWWWKNRRPSASGVRGIKRSKGVRLHEVKPKTCRQCGTGYSKRPKETYAAFEARLYCGPDCKSGDQSYLILKGRPGAVRVALTCLQCCVTFEVELYRIRAGAKFCSWRCAGAYRDRGYTAADKRIRSSAEYKRWRKAVFGRDDYTCQICGIRGGELNADHIKPFAHFPELRFDVDNGRTLCVPCHRQTDTYGTKAVRLHLGAAIPQGF